MYVEQGGELYGFCPAKATWDPSLVEKFRLLMIVAETGAMLRSGGIYEQPEWLIESLGWFLPKYHVTKISMIGKMFLPAKKAGSSKTVAPRRVAARGGNHR